MQNTTAIDTANEFRFDIALQRIGISDKYTWYRMEILDLYTCVPVPVNLDSDESCKDIKRPFPRREYPYSSGYAVGELGDKFQTIRYRRLHPGEENIRSGFDPQMKL